MLKMTTAVAIALIVAFAAGPVAAQTCSIGVYGDAAGSESLVSPVVGEPFDVYVVMFLEGLANGVGYTLVGNDLDDFLTVGASYGVGGGGLNIPNAAGDEYFGGSNVGLGQCAVGFNGSPIGVAKYTLVALTSTREASLTVTGNPNSSSLDPAFPVFSDCNGVIGSCDIAPSLTIELPVSDDNASFGAVKSLFN